MTALVGAVPTLRDVATPEGLARAIETLGTEPDACLVCAAPEPRRAFEKSGKWFWSCGACGLVFVHDIYPEYAAGFDEGEYEGLVEGRELKARERRDIARVLAELAGGDAPGTLLEIGCGEGLFLREAAAAGWRVRGVEILPSMVARARDVHGLDVTLGDPLEAGFEPGSFDAVYMNEVIEHVVDPVELMTEVHRVLRPGGTAVVRTGNARSWSARLRGADWWYYWFCGHGHIRFYGPAAARALGAAAGFASVRCRTRGFAARESDELRGRWWKPPVKWGQALVSPVAGALGAGHRISMYFERGDA